MSRNNLVSINNIGRLIGEGYVSIDGVDRKILKGYVGKNRKPFDIVIPQLRIIELHPHLGGLPNGYVFIRWNGNVLPVFEAVGGVSPYTWTVTGFPTTSHANGGWGMSVHSGNTENLRVSFLGFNQNPYLLLTENTVYPITITVTDAIGDIARLYYPDWTLFVPHILGQHVVPLDRPSGTQIIWTDGMPIVLLLYEYRVRGSAAARIVGFTSYETLANNNSGGVSSGAVDVRRGDLVSMEWDFSQLPWVRVWLVLNGVRTTMNALTNTTNYPNLNFSIQLVNRTHANP